MRIKLSFSESNSSVEFVNQHYVNSFIHQTLGPNNQYHNEKNDYVISDLRGGVINNNNSGLDFPNGGFVIVSSMNLDFLDDIVNNLPIMSNRDFNIHGMRYLKFEFLPPENFFHGVNYFVTLSPILLKKYSDKKNYRFITLKDDSFIDELTKHTISKFTKINPNLDFSHFNISLAKDKKINKTKRIYVKNVQNMASLCQLEISCNKDVATHIYEYGLGQSTGSGFGCVYKTENRHLYKV